MKSREDAEKDIAVIVQRCSQFAEASLAGDSETSGHTPPDVRRISLIARLALEACGEDAAGEGLEVGCGYSSLLFSIATFLPGIRWSAVDHPEREYVKKAGYLTAFTEFNCQLRTVDIIREPLPFQDDRFLLVTCSEVLEHLPVERLCFVLSEMVRVIRPGGFLIASSPNQASMENRLLLLRGRSILEMPKEKDFARGTFGHIRLYTLAEIREAMEQLGLTLVQFALESNNSGYRGSSEDSWLRRGYRLYEWLERRLPLLKGMGDTWYAVFKKEKGSPTSE